MIRHIEIKNFAIIENVNIDFNEGLNIITGETGAGKSIVIEAVSLALGSRADTAFVRSGCDKAVVQMIADYNDGNTSQEYIITREISSSGRNTCRINDEIVTLATLSKLCTKLADIHGQYDHQSLLDPDKHIRLVDLYRKDLIAPMKSSVSFLYAEYTELLSELAQLKKDRSESLRQKDFMEYELAEIRNAHLTIGEDATLEEEIKILQNSEKIYGNLASAYQMTSDSEFSLLSAMKQVSDIVSEISAYSSEFAELDQRIAGLYYEYEDACSSIRDCRDKIVFDPAVLDRKIERYELINRLKTKHSRSIEELLDYADALDKRLSSINNSDEELSKLEAKINDTDKSLSLASKNLSAARMESAGELEKLITSELMQLNFSDADFSINFKHNTGFTAEGTDIVEFLISTNRGEPLKPLSRIASGGEMSRIMLAFKKIIGDYDEIPTMIFDEIDSGISGIAASVVGRKLREISGSHQIICITHLPQIAAFGTTSFRISKHSDASMTYTTVDALSESESTVEIARLLGGENITSTTLESARELIQASRKS